MNECYFHFLVQYGFKHQTNTGWSYRKRNFIVHIFFQIFRHHHSSSNIEQKDFRLSIASATGSRCQLVKPLASGAFTNISIKRLYLKVEEFNHIKSFAWSRFYFDQKIMISSKLSKFDLLWNSRLSTANSSWCSLSLRWIGDSIDVSFAAWDADLVRKDDSLSAMECDRYCAPMIIK